MDKIELLSDKIKGEGALTFPRAVAAAILDVLGKIDHRLPRSSRSGFEVELKPGVMTVCIADERAMDNREESVTQQYGKNLVDAVTEFNRRRIQAKEDRAPVPVFPADSALEVLNEALHHAAQNGVSVAFRDENQRVTFDPVDPQEIYVRGQIAPPQDLAIDCVCAGARVVSAPDGQLELFADQPVDLRIFLYNAEVEEVRYRGALSTAWLVRPFACRIVVKCQRARPDNKYVVAMEQPTFFDVTATECLRNSGRSTGADAL